MPVMSVGLSRRAIATSWAFKKKYIYIIVWIQWKSLDPETKRMVYTKHHASRDSAHFSHSKLWTCTSLEGAFVGGKNLSSQLQNATSKFSGKSQINVIKLIKLDDDMCHLNWHHIGISKFATCHLAHRIKINSKFMDNYLYK